MGGLFDALTLGFQNLSNMQTGISTVNENVANVNTPGYSRRRMIMKAGPTQFTASGAMGSGAFVDRIESVRDSFVEKRLRNETETLGFFQGQEFGVRELETILAGGEDASIANQMSRFFDSFLELSGEPTSVSLRQSVLAEADQLASWFQTATRQFDDIDLGNQNKIEDSVDQINFLLGRIAEINKRLVPQLALGDDGGALYDERQELVNQLSQEIGIQIVEDENANQLISTTNGKLLLAGAEVQELKAEGSSSGMSVLLGAQDISAEISTGNLGGLLDFQNNVLVGFRDMLNKLAGEVATAVNAVHSNGSDLNGNPGADLFSVTAGDEARTFALEISDPEEIAAAASGAAVGDGSNAQALADLRDQRLIGLDNQSVGEYYSFMVFEVGLATRSVEGNLALQEKVVLQLKNERESISGVSLDEEAIQLLQYQRSYQASARMISVINSLLDETLNLVR